MRLLALLAVLGLSAVVVHAQPPPPGGGNPPAQVPIDGGLSLLAIAGGAYAVRKLRQSE